MGRKFTPENSLANKFPNLIKEWDFSKNKELNPSNISYGSGRKAWWICPNCKESYIIQIADRTNQNCGCPYCSGHQVCNWNCLFTKFPKIAKQWHPYKNKSLTPNNFTYGSGYKAWWFCETCKESYSMPIRHRTQLSQNCPYCRGLKVCNSNCLASTHPNIAKQWNYTKNGNITPNDITPHSGKKFWWSCSFCNKNILKSCDLITNRNKSTVICSDCNFYENRGEKTPSRPLAWMRLRRNARPRG